MIKTEQVLGWTILDLSLLQCRWDGRNVVLDKDLGVALWALGPGRDDQIEAHLCLSQLKLGSAAGTSVYLRHDASESLQLRTSTHLRDCSYVSEFRPDAACATLARARLLATPDPQPVMRPSRPYRHSIANPSVSSRDRDGEELGMSS
jgi:hypothetical protein